MTRRIFGQDAEKPIPFEEIKAALGKLLNEVGPVRVPRNVGNRRTESKKALLRAIEGAGGSW